MDLSIVNYNLISYLIFPFISVVVLYLLKSYNTMFRYININDILKLLTGIILSSLIFFIYAHNFEKNFEINHLLLFFFSFSFLVFYRIVIKILFSRINTTTEHLNNIMIFSAGNSGIITKRAFYNSSEFKIVGFIDDDKMKIGKTLDGVTVFKLGNKLNKFIVDNNVSKVIISTNKLSIPSPNKAPIKCSMVETFAPNSFSIVVFKEVLVTFIKFGYTRLFCL